MVRVLFVATEFPAISETFVLDQVTGLIDRGFDVQILAAKRRDEKISHTVLQSYNLPARSHYADWSRARSKGAIWRLLSRRHVKLVIEMIRLVIARGIGRRAVSGPRQLYAFALTLQAMPAPDLVLCHFGVNGDLTVRLRAALQADWPVATFFHGFDISKVLEEYSPNVYKRLFNEGELFLPACEFFSRRLFSLGAPVTKTIVQRMGVRPQPASVQRDKRAASSAFTFVIVGRMVEKKGYKFALRALANCRKQAPHKILRIICIGEGPLMPMLKSCAAKLSIEEFVEFRGSQTREVVMRTLLEDANAFLLPSVTAANGDMEASPVAISEAMSLGLPVISTYHSGIPELVIDGETGLLAVERDVASLSAAMLRLSESPELASALGEAGRKRLEREFNLDQWNDRLAERINTLILR